MQTREVAQNTVWKFELIVVQSHPRSSILPFWYQSKVHNATSYSSLIVTIGTVLLGHFHNPLLFQSSRFPSMWRQYCPKTAQHTPITKLYLLSTFKLLYCTKFGQLILMKIMKIVATRSHILRLKCTKFDFGWSSAPDPAGGCLLYTSPSPRD